MRLCAWRSASPTSLHQAGGGSPGGDEGHQALAGDGVRGFAGVGGGVGCSMCALPALAERLHVRQLRDESF